MRKLELVDSLNSVVEVPLSSELKDGVVDDVSVVTAVDFLVRLSCLEELHVDPGEMGLPRLG